MNSLPGTPMKTALVTTTIHLPEVLKLYRRFDTNIKFFVAGDRKTPEAEVASLVGRLGNARYLSVDEQPALGGRVSELIGWDCIQRRNIALLQAIGEGFDLIITIDDDNIPLSEEYFDRHRSVLSRPFNGVGLSHPSGWVDIGQFISPSAPHRGFPYEERKSQHPLAAGAVVDGHIGVSAGLWMGDPDVDAMTRIVQQPFVQAFSAAIDAGVAVQPGCTTVFNSQNTGFTAEIAPAMMVLSEVGRYDDIWASLIAQRIMGERGLLVHFGRPYVWQERNEQSLWRNLEEEMFGMRETSRFARDLAECDIGGGSVVDQLRRIYRHLATKDYLPSGMVTIGQAWCDEVEERLAAL